MLPIHFSNRQPQIFTAPGYLTTSGLLGSMPGYVWHKPPHATLVAFFLVGAGAAGSTPSAASTTGGAGGGGGAVLLLIAPALFLPSCLYILPGMGGKGDFNDINNPAATPTVIKNESNIILASAKEGSEGSGGGGAGGTAAACLTYLAQCGGLATAYDGGTGGAPGGSSAGGNVTSFHLTSGGGGGAGGAFAGGSVTPAAQFDTPNGADIVPVIAGGASGQPGKPGQALWSHGVDFNFFSLGGSGAGGHATGGSGLNGGNGGLGSGGGGGGGQTTFSASRGGHGGDGIALVWVI